MTHPTITGTTALKQSKHGKPAHPVKTVAVLGAGLMGAGKCVRRLVGSVLCMLCADGNCVRA